jgi:uncharacterized DUF497 family protein
LLATCGVQASVPLAVSTDPEPSRGRRGHRAGAPRAEGLAVLGIESVSAYCHLYVRMASCRTLGEIDGFDWDTGNREKCEKHGLSMEAIELVLRGTIHVFPDVAHSRVETRYLAIGRGPDGRHVFVAFTLRRLSGSVLLRPISARYMHAKEVKHYEAEVARTRQ